MEHGERKVDPPESTTRVRRRLRQKQSTGRVSAEAPPGLDRMALRSESDSDSDSDSSSDSSSDYGSDYDSDSRSGVAEDVPVAASRRGSPCKVGTAAALALLWLGLIAAAVHFGSLDHPFVLADNRHYTFYLWRFMRRNAVRYGLVPAYLVAGLVVVGRIARQWKSLAVAQLLVLACVLVLVPAHLVEPRYFNVPVFAVLILSGLRPPEGLVLATLGLLAHAVALGVFWFRPF